METIKDKIERHKILAELFLKENIRVYIKDIDNTYYFCDILEVKEDILIIKCFAPIDKINKSYNFYWANIIDLKKYEEKNGS